MQKKLLTFFFLSIAIFACRKQDVQQASNQPWLLGEKVETSDLDQLIKATMLNTGEFWWSSASNQQVWAALSQSDHILSVGYKPAAQSSNLDDIMHQIDIKDQTWRAAHDVVLDLILKSEQELNPGIALSDLMYHDNDVLPFLNIRIFNPATVELVRNSALVRYAEPIGYEPFKQNQAAERSGSGCDSNSPEYSLVSGTDFTTITPATKRSWNYSFHNIPQAWSNSTGAGTRVVIIDTGASDSQENLGENFNQGSSTGRMLSKLVTLPQETNFWGNPVGSPETPNDLCGHGTSMAGACAAPRGTDGNATGIAYNCNLTTYRAAADVYLDESREVTGVSNAFIQAGGNSSVRIISMSMGRLLSSSQMRDAIIFAHNNGKLIFCAAGTSYSWTAWFAGVIYPASLSQAVAVTGVKTNLTSRCSNCHDGSKVDFVVVMEKSSGNQFPLSLADDTDQPSTVGGSSVATASTAGMAALVWSKYPSWSRQQVYDRLKTSSSNSLNRHSTFGWGRINAQLATQ
jgi:subtilisin family serine protease